MTGLLKKYIYALYQVYRYSAGKAKVYHRVKEKSRFSKAKDLLGWLCREKYFNSNYYAFGLNVQGADQREYIGRNEFLAIKNNAEAHLKQKAGCRDFSYDVVTKDKFYANSVFSANGIDCVENHALIKEGKVFYPDAGSRELNTLLEIKDAFFIKHIVLEAGDGVMHCRNREGQLWVDNQMMTVEELADRLEGKVWIVQKSQRSHPEIARINDSALNTTRIVTILDGQTPVYLAGFQSFATGNETTDSWSKGSVYVGLDIVNSALKRYGYLHPGVGEKSLVEEHPDSGVKFEGYRISQLKNAVDLCIRAHRILYFNFVIGWDVAITEGGALILEANEKPGMNAVQCMDGGLRKRIKECYYKFISE